MESLDPGSGRPFISVAAGDRDDIDHAVGAAKKALRGEWGRLSTAARARILHQAGALILENLERLAVAETLDCGKPLNEALADVRGAARAFEYYAGPAINGRAKPSTSGRIIMATASMSRSV